MEIYRNELSDVVLKVPVTSSTGTIDVTARDGSTILHTFSTVDVVTGGYKVSLPFSLVESDSEFVIRWEFNYLEDGQEKPYKSETPVRVITPYVTSDEIHEAIPDIDSFASASELNRIERRIRGVIENYTGQRFGRYVYAKQIIGTGESQLKLPERLVSLENISGSNVLESAPGVSAAGFYAIRGDGYYVGISSPTPEGDYVFENVIRDPDSMWNRGGFRDNVVYTIDGVWGYDEVPTEVKEAALILIEDAACPQSEYRDRYLKAISGDGWRYEFTPTAYAGTGSVTADQLLEQFRRITMTVI